MVTLRQLAYARSGDKGAGANVGVIALTQTGFEFLRRALTAEAVKSYFSPMCSGHVVRYEMPNLLALNFVLSEILDGGGSLSLRIDAQGKTLAQILLEMPIDVPEDVLTRCC